MPRTKTVESAETATATLTYVAPCILVLRYRDDAQFSPEEVMENMNAIKQMCDRMGPCCLLNIFPAGMMVQPPMMNDDYYRDQRDRQRIKAMAVVTDSMEMYTASKLYFVYHPQPFDALVFEEEHEALEWLKGFCGQSKD